MNNLWPDGINGKGINGEGINGEGINGEGINGEGINYTKFVPLMNYLWLRQRIINTV